MLFQSLRVPALALLWAAGMLSAAAQPADGPTAPAGAASAPVGDTSAAARASAPVPEVLRLPLTVEGAARDIVVEVFKPPGPGPFPFVLFAHGRAGTAVERANMQHPIGAGHARYWLRKGVAVIAPVRPGYGATGGPDLENNYNKWRDGHCFSDPDYTAIAQHARATQLAVLQWIDQQPWARPDRGLIEGQSVGGMTTVALAALNPPGVLGAVNFAGGAGGDPGSAPGHSCRPENLRETYRLYGTQTRIPTLWLYAANDQYWGPEVPVQWYEAFKAGGSDVQLLHTGPVDGADGHLLLARGPALWRDTLDAFVQKVGLLAP